jgi:general secretion pathway protein H
MQISAAGNEVRGFTLLELMVVVAIVALASVAVTLSLRDSGQAQLDTEAQRLAVLLESARAQSRTLGVPVIWRPTATGFVFEGASALPSHWQNTDPNTDIAASVTRPLLLGPEPLISPQRVRLWMRAQPGRVLWVATDGVRPFAVQADSGATAAPPTGAMP